jgi:hypothetical protein
MSQVDFLPWRCRLSRVARKRKETWDVARLDTPESAPDFLGRDALASTIARGLLRSRPSESLITAVYGPWGSGKSWLKHRVLKKLAGKKKQITVVEFSPWQIRGVDELTLQFFAQVHDHLVAGTHGDAAGALAKREKMWMALARLSGAGAAALKVIGGAAAFSEQGKFFAPSLMAIAGVTERFAKLLQSAAEDIHVKVEKSRPPSNADEARQELATLFADPNLPRLLIVMDDFDRQTSDEIQTLVRLIKANANFPGLNYLILCDPEQLAAALDPVACNKGKEFLEKIVQNPIRLPSPDADSIIRQLANGLENIAKRTDYPLDQHLDRLRSYFQNFLRLRLRNLRSVYRLLEALDFSAAALTRDGKLEVDLLDLLAVDFLRLHAPALADWIQEVRPSFYVFTALRDLFDDDRKQPLKEILPVDLIESFGVANSYSVLRTLFPQVAKQFPKEEAAFNRTLASLGEIQKDYPLALSHEEHFDTYFRLQPHALKVPESAYLAAVTGAMGRLELTQHLSRWISEGWMPSALRRLKADIDAFSTEQRKSLFLALADCSDLVGRNDDAVSFDGELRSTMYRMEELLQGLPEKEREASIDDLFASVQAITARLLMLENLRIRSAPESWKDRAPKPELPIFPTDKIDKLRENLAAAAKPEISDRSYFDHPRQGFRLYRWRNAVGKKHTEAFLRESLERGNLPMVLTVVRGVARDMVGQYDMSFEDSGAYATSSSKGLTATLTRFASEDFWQDFGALFIKEFPPTDTPKAGDDCLIQHLRRAFRVPDTDSPAA